MTEYFYPERMGRIILMALEEVIGRDGLRTILDLVSRPLAHERVTTMPGQKQKELEMFANKTRTNLDTVQDTVDSDE